MRYLGYRTKGRGNVLGVALKNYMENSIGDLLLELIVDNIL